MADREKLIECLKYCVSTSITQNTCEYCERWDFDCGSYHCVDELMMQAATALEQQRWIPVTERLPEEGETVLVFGYWHEKFQPLMCYLSPHRKGEWFTTVAGQQVYTVTHWMPLPEPPKGE